MPFLFDLDDLLEYSDWDRAQWRAWFLEQGPKALSTSLGPNADGRFRDIGELVRHIFSAEKRYVERSLKAPLTDTSTIPANDVSALFALGQESRRALRQLLATFPEAEWEAPREMQFGKQSWVVTPRVMIIQAVTHELRHWAQIATLLRSAGYKLGMHDFIANPALSGAVPRGGAG
jgi:uncharacterized damage-inducible protein DinB